MTDSASNSASKVALHDFQPSTSEFLSDVLDGLGRAQKSIPAKYFYDQRGCELFDDICELPEYYPTRTELQLMDDHAGEIADCIGPQCMLIEFGSGSSVKTRNLLNALENPAAYVPVEIAREHLEQTAAGINRAYPALEVLPVCADFTGYFELPESSSPPRRKVVYFPGSTIGNLETPDACNLLRSISFMAGASGGMLLGFDLQKDTATLEAAYNDTAGVTAAFNLNLLHRINEELGGNFEVDRFAHHAFYNEQANRIEMHLRSKSAQTVTIAGEAYEFTAGESILTEYSHKYDLNELAATAATCGLKLAKTWTDARNYFAVAYFRVV